MKSKLAVLALIATAFAATNASAYYYYHGPAHPYYHGETVYYWWYCAPEVNENNVAAVDRVVNEIAQRPEFASAVQFRDALKNIQSIQTIDEKIAAYMGTMGLDTKSSQSVVDFAYAREVKAEQITALQNSTGLSADQAKTVANAVAQAIRGGLQK